MNRMVNIHISEIGAYNFTFYLTKEIEEISVIIGKKNNKSNKYRTDSVLKFILSNKAGFR